MVIAHFEMNYRLQHLRMQFFSSDAAEVLRANRRLFEQNVQRAMRGGYVGSVYFERCLK